MRKKFRGDEQRGTPSNMLGVVLYRVTQPLLCRPPPPWDVTGISVRRLPVAGVFCRASAALPSGALTIVAIGSLSPWEDGSSTYPRHRVIHNMGEVDTPSSPALEGSRFLEVASKVRLCAVSVRGG